jgi:hypothetical protein
VVPDRVYWQVVMPLLLNRRDLLPQLELKSYSVTCIVITAKDIGSQDGRWMELAQDHI